MTAYILKSPRHIASEILYCGYAMSFCTILKNFVLFFLARHLLFYKFQGIWYIKCSISRFYF